MTATLRYMGSKRSLAPRIASLITAMHPYATIADTFAGTCAIGNALAPRHIIFANDIHEFAERIARVLLVSPGPIPTLQEAWSDLLEAYTENYRSLMQAVGDRVREERQALSMLVTSRNWRDLMHFTVRELSEEVPRQLPGIEIIGSYGFAQNLHKN
jgi:hypothetical protein